MFIVSKRAFKLKTPDGGYKIPKDYIGDIPDSIAEHPLIQNAIKGGWIAVPESHADKALYKADEKAAVSALEADIRPDAPKADKYPDEAAKPVKKASRRVKTQK